MYMSTGKCDTTDIKVYLSMEKYETTTIKVYLSTENYNTTAIKVCLSAEKYEATAIMVYLSTEMRLCSLETSQFCPYAGDYHVATGPGFLLPVHDFLNPTINPGLM